MATERIPVTVNVSSAVEGARDISALINEIKELRKQGRRQVQDPTRELRENARRTSGVVRELGAEFRRLFAAGAIVEGVRRVTRAFIESEQALNNLNSAARVAGEGFTSARAAAEQLAREGLGSVRETAAGLSNLLQTGFNLDEAVEISRALGDIGAFGRTQVESLGQAFVTTTRGIRSNRAALIDNIGVTESLRDQWEEAAGGIEGGADALSQAEKNQATLNFLLEQGAQRTGDLARLQETLGGQTESTANQIQGLAAEFGEALAPALRGVQTILEFSLPLFRRYLQFWRSLGAVVGFAATQVASAFELLQTRDLDAFLARGRAGLQALRDQIVDTFAEPPGIDDPGDPAQANAAAAAARRAALEAESARQRAQREKREQAAREKAEREAERERKAAERERVRAAKLAAREEEQIEEALARARVEIARTTGTLTAEARREAIAREFEDVRGLLEARGNEAGIALIENLINVRAAEEEFAELERVLQRDLARIRDQQRTITSQQAAGLLTQTQARQQIVDLQQQSADIIDETIPKLEELAQALGPDAVEAVAGWRQELERASLVADELGIRIKGEVGDALTELFVDIGKGAKSATEALRDFAQSVLSSFQRILAERFAERLLGQFSGLFGGGGGRGGGGGLGGLLSGLFGGGFAQGGYVSGPGGPTSDSIPARLSAGEYVLRASAVDALGVNFLHALNRISSGGLGPAPLRFANGGEVPGAAAAAPAAGGVRVVNVMDPSLAEEYLTSSAGERTVLNIIERNRGAVNQSLG